MSLYFQNPAEDCQALGFCSAKEYPLIDMQPAEIEITHDDVIALQQNGPKMTHVGTSVQCVLCEFVMTQLDNMLTQNATEVRRHKFLCIK